MIVNVNPWVDHCKLFVIIFGIAVCMLVFGMSLMRAGDYGQGTVKGAERGNDQDDDFQPKDDAKSIDKSES